MPTTPTTKRKHKTKTLILPPWNVLIHNDNTNDFDYIVTKVSEIARVNIETATRLAKEAHETGQSIVLTTNLEQAELAKDRFTSSVPPIQSTIERA